MDVLDLVNALVIPLADLQKKLADIPEAIEETRRLAYQKGFTEGAESKGDASSVEKLKSDLDEANKLLKQIEEIVNK